MLMPWRFTMGTVQKVVKVSLAVSILLVMCQITLVWRKMDSHVELQRKKLKAQKAKTVQHIMTLQPHGQHDSTMTLTKPKGLLNEKARFLSDASHNATLWRDLDLMMLPQFKTLPEFTSPCWWVQDVPEDKCPQSMKRSREPLEWIASNRRKTGESRVLRCLPYFFIIGQCKCGTSDLFSRINSHPDVAPHAMKETQWVRRSQLRESCTSIDTYLYLLQKSASYIQKNHRKDTVSPYIIGDATPAYFSFNEFWDMLPGNEGCKEPCVTNPDLIHHLNPQARLILSLRNPTNRLYSYYFHMAGFSKRKVSKQAFHDLVVREINVFKDCLTSQSLRGCCYNYTNSFSRTHEIDLQRGIYHVFLSDWLNVFPREQLYVLKFEEYAINVSHYLAELFKFLDLRTLSETELTNIIDRKAAYQRHYGQDVGDMMNETRQLLDDFYRPHNQKLSILVGRTNFNW